MFLVLIIVTVQAWLLSNFVVLIFFKYRFLLNVKNESSRFSGQNNVAYHETESVFTINKNCSIYPLCRVSMSWQEEVVPETN